MFALRRVYTAIEKGCTWYVCTKRKLKNPTQHSSSPEKRSILTKGLLLSKGIIDRYSGDSRAALTIMAGSAGHITYLKHANQQQALTPRLLPPRPPGPARIRSAGTGDGGGCGILRRMSKMRRCQGINERSHRSTSLLVVVVVFIEQQHLRDDPIFYLRSSLSARRSFEHNDQAPPRYIK